MVRYSPFWRRNMGTTKKLAIFFQVFFFPSSNLFRHNLVSKKFMWPEKIRIPMSLAFLAGARDFKQ